MSEELRNEPHFFSGMLNRKLKKVFSLVCTHGNSNIAILILLSCEHNQREVNNLRHTLVQSAQKIWIVTT